MSNLHGTVRPRSNQWAPGEEQVWKIFLHEISRFTKKQIYLSERIKQIKDKSIEEHLLYNKRITVNDFIINKGGKKNLIGSIGTIDYSYLKKKKKENEIRSPVREIHNK